MKAYQIVRILSSKTLRRHDKGSYLRLVGCLHWLLVRQHLPVSPIRKRKGNYGIQGLDEASEGLCSTHSQFHRTSDCATSMLKHCQGQSSPNDKVHPPSPRSDPHPHQFGTLHFCKLCPLFSSYTPQSS